jgi:Tfp pilus assembly protein PilX
MEPIERGSILIVVLWLVAILGLVASALAFHSRTELRLTAFQWDMERLTQTAKLKATQAVTLVEKSSASPNDWGICAAGTPPYFPEKEEAPLSVDDESSKSI